MRTGESPGFRPLHEDVEAALERWIETDCEGKQVSRLLVISKALEIDPQFLGHHKLQQVGASCSKPTLTQKRELEAVTEQWVRKASCWYYRFKRRKNYTMLAVAGAGRNDISDLQAECDKFAEVVLEARRLEDGSLIPPEHICAFDQTPMTREITGRKTLRKKGSGTRRTKIRTAGKEKERWTYTPLLFGDGRWRRVRGLATFHGAPPPSSSQLTKSGVKRKLGVRTIAHMLRNWQTNGFPAGMVYSCNKTAWYTPREAQLTVSALRRIHGQGRPDLPTTLTIADDFSVHKMASFREALEGINSRLRIVKGGMSSYCNPGDRLINKVSPSPNPDPNPDLNPDPNPDPDPNHIPQPHNPNPKPDPDPDPAPDH